MLSYLVFEGWVAANLIHKGFDWDCQGQPRSSTLREKYQKLEILLVHTDFGLNAVIFRGNLSIHFKSEKTRTGKTSNQGTFYVLVSGSEVSKNLSNRFKGDNQAGVILEKLRGDNSLHRRLHPPPRFNMVKVYFHKPLCFRSNNVASEKSIPWLCFWFPWTNWRSFSSQ